MMDMKKPYKLFILFPLIFIFSILFSVFASALTFDHSYQQDGNTYLGKFHVKDLSADDLQNWKDMMASPRLFAEQDNNHKIYFLIVPEGVTGKIIRNSPGSSFTYNVQFSPAFDCKGLVFQYSSSTGMYELVGHYNSDRFTGFGLDAIIVNRGFPLSSNIAASELYIQHPGLLYIEDDLGGTMEGEGEVEDEDPWWQHLLDWLNSFWQKLKKFIVPEDGYFDDWFNDVKAAAMKKLGPISDVNDKLHGAFNSFKNDTSFTGLYLDLPANYIYDGFPGARISLLRGVDSILSIIRTLLTMIIVIFTVVCCYKRIVVLFEQ